MIHEALEVSVIRVLPQRKDTIFSQRIENVDSIAVPYERIVSVLRFMFGSKVLITFSLSSYESKK